MKSGNHSAGQLFIDRHTYLTAIAVIDEYGGEATKHAAKRSSKFEKEEDALGSQYWDGVIVAILGLDRTWRRPGEIRH